jgi:hypothetical protein
MAQPLGSKDRIDLLSALLTPTIAIAAVAIAFLQWHLHRSKLRYELFDRRYGIFDKIKMFIKLNIKNPSLSDTECLEFLQETKGSGFLFSEEIEKFVNELYEKAIDLQTYHADAQAGNTAEHVKERSETKKWFMQQLRTVDSRFWSFLSLKDW